jgi:hypothetical protein
MRIIEHFPICLDNLLLPCSPPALSFLCSEYPERFHFTIMMATQAKPVPPSSRLRQARGMMERRANCTHVSMVMVYGPYRCSSCNRRGGFGSIYQCSQDLPERYSGENEIVKIDHIVRNGAPGRTSIFQPLDLNTPNSRQKDGEPRVEFNPNISRELCSPDQWEILLKQKLHVRACMTLYSQHPRNNDLTKLLVPGSIIASTPNIAIDNISQDVSSAQDESSSGRKALEKHFRDDDPPTCSVKICHHCRPSFLERTWGRIDAIALLDPALLPRNTPSEFFRMYPHTTISNGISSAEVVRNLGLRQPPPGSSLVIDPDLEVSSLSSSKASSSSSGRDRSYHGFRQSLTRAFRGMLRSRRQSNRSSRRPRSLHEEDHALSEVSKEELTKEDDGDVTLWAQLDEENLRVATIVPLPERDSEDDAKGFGGGEVILKDGVAVTEEAVGERMADIIIL